MIDNTQNTHKKINPKLWGDVVFLGKDEAHVKILLTEKMAADEYGLIHGGTIFGVADYAAMLAVNHPNVVLAAAEVKFLKPCRVGEEVVAEAKVIGRQNKKQRVFVEVKRNNDVVFTGKFLCVVLDKHVLSD